MANKFIPPIWENPEIQEINRLPIRSPLLPFGSAKDALAECIAGPEFEKPGENPWYFGLDGQWSFKLLDNPYDDEKDGVGCTGIAFGLHAPDWTDPSYKAAWPEIKVPGTWTRQGYDKPHYTNVQMPFNCLPPNAPEKNPTGLYRRTITIPAAWKNRRTVLHIGSAESVLLVYVNGTFAGAGKDTRLPQEFDITAFLSSTGKNTICLKVVRYSDASYVEDQDEWWLGGIHRSVYLYSTAPCFIQDIEAIPGRIVEEGGKKKGKFNLKVTLGGNLPTGRISGNVAVIDKAEKAKADAEAFTISYALYPFSLPASRTEALEYAAGLGKKQKALVSGELKLECNYRINSNRVEAELAVPNPLPWSHEGPNLYLLTVSLSQNSKHIESAAFCTAFRTVLVSKRELLINNRAVLIKGANRHEHDEYTGKTQDTKKMLRDIELLKTHNFNAVRTSHYPNDERWYDLCDRYGIYLVDEADIENHAFYDQICWDIAWANAYAIRTQRMVKRDKNHPSIIIWSLGNESGDGGNHSMISAWVHRYDPSRPVNYEGAIRPEKGQGGFTLDSLNRSKELTDIIGPMYPQIDLITDFTKYREDHRPLIMIEYSHAMGNSNGNLADYWEAIETHHGLQGGFIWEWIDHGFAAEGPKGQKYWKYGGDFGDTPSDMDFCCDGLLWPDQTPKPAMEECRQVFCPIKLKPVPSKPYTFIVENHLDFTVLNAAVELVWSLKAEASVLKGEAVLAKGKLALPALAPGESAEISLPVPAKVDFKDYDGAIYIHADFLQKKAAPFVKAGHVLGSAQRILRESLGIKKNVPVPASSKAAEELSTFMDSFTPSLFRVPTQNDGLKVFIPLRGDPAGEFYYRGKAMFPWLDLDLLHMRSVDAKIEDTYLDGFEAKRYTANLIAGPGADKQFKDRFLGTYTKIAARPAIPGKGPQTGNPLILDFTFDLAGDLPELAKVGVSAKIPAEYSNISWFGGGQHESYPDRLAAAFLGLYSGTPEELEVPYVMPQENGNRSGLRVLALGSKKASPGKPRAVIIRPDKPLNFSISRYTQENLMEALHTIDLKDVTAGAKGYYTLNIDIAQRGLGTATCGPDTLEKYRVRPGLFKMRLYIGAEY
ncbi:glycoside hydrolase family 2 TIM barrel-domain containing protein [Leadbettera azotonutricia]|uniref:Beta-galactosidase n=1 Tax=Leadbettera azotonutricia (strain ATCC BAA-888 / DSM 13862 / ZAS-9) TaxID=545695 RepID=F5Y6M1_LEAAZ|nr:glycoside hydrolase family 2 TIM barrel-domain containing protein [Leadbettera azotonutricia]AEF80165.1 beta-galactosidase (Lactase) [Leadbettera azotonutricia ZAS-9]